MKLAMIFLAATAVAFSASAQPTNPPGMSLSLTNQTGTNYLSLSVTNHVAGRYYTVWYAYDLTTPLRLWIGPYITGQTNQTNFVMLEPQSSIAFLQARNGIDQDGDGVPDNQDADAFDSQVGTLQVIIYTPANGSTIQ